SGDIAFTIDAEAPARFALSLRIPAWARDARLAVNGQALDLEAITANGYARIERVWAPGDTATLTLPLELRTLRAHPAVRQDAGRVAIARGPLVYCLAGADNGSGRNSILLQDGLGRAQTATIADLRGAIAIDLPVLRERAETWGDELYTEKVPETAPDTARLVPYHLWDNRDPGEMLVWVREVRG